MSLDYGRGIKNPASSLLWKCFEFVDKTKNLGSSCKTCVNLWIWKDFLKICCNEFMTENQTIDIAISEIMNIFLFLAKFF